MSRYAVPQQVANRVQVDLTKMPRSNPYRPDFLATGPHAVIEKNKPLSFMAKSDAQDDEEEAGPGYKFYESDKLLGRLFRAIDERQFLSSVQDEADAGLSRPPSRAQSILKPVWKHIQRQCLVRGCEMPDWRRHVSRARGIRDE